MWNEYELTISAAMELKNDKLDNPSEMKKHTCCEWLSNCI